MSSRRVIVLLITALVVIASAIWISSQRHLPRDITAGTPLLPDIKPVLDQVSEIRLAKADGTHTTLKRNGTDWMVHERHFVADGAKVRKLLVDVASLQIKEEKTSNTQLYSALNVEDVPAPNPDAPISVKPPKANQYDFTEPMTATRIDLITPGKTWSVIDGKSGGYKEGYVRIVGAKQSFLASPRLEADVEPQRWLDKAIADIPEARIQSVAVQPAKGPAYSVSRDKKETQNFAVSNIPPKRKLANDSSGNALANGLEGLSLDDVQKNPDVPPAPLANTTVELTQATYKTFDGITVEVRGRKESTPGLKKEDPKIEKAYITLTASSTQKATQEEAQKLNARAAGLQFEISTWKFDGMFKPLEDLLETLPTKDKGKDKNKDNDKGKKPKDK